MSQGPNPFDVHYVRPTGPRIQPEPTSTPHRGRWWSPVLVVFASFLTFFVASGVMIVVACIAVHGEFNQRDRKSVV